MVSYAEHDEEPSSFNFDYDIFDEEEHGYDTTMSEDGSTSVVSEMGEEESAESVMQVDNERQGVAPNQVFNMDTMAHAVHTPTRTRATSCDSSDEEGDESDTTLLNPSPSPRLRPTRARLARKNSEITMFSPSPSPLVERTSSPAPSSFSASSELVKVKVEKKYKGPVKAKKRSGGCNRNPINRDSQNRKSQQTYRDKVKDSATMMGNTSIEVEVAYMLNRSRTAEEQLEIIKSIIREAKAALKALHPTLAAKHEQLLQEKLAAAQ